MNTQLVLGIDIGGTGIKGAPVDVQSGQLAAERLRMETPQPATPAAVAQTVAKLAAAFSWKGPIGIGFPAAVQQGMVMTASNIDKSWIGVQGDRLFAEATGCPVHLLNDADVAAEAEMHFGAGHNQKGVTMMITVGTGIGTAFFINGMLVPNTELGHIHLPGHTEIAEKYCSNATRERESLSWEVWAHRFDEYLNYMYKLFYPSLMIIGGGQSKSFEKYRKLLTVPTKVVPAQLLNNAGIIGAAVAGAERQV